MAEHLRSFPYTDTGNGERLAHQFAGQIRYSHPQRTWFIYTGRRWKLDQTGDMLQRAKWIARALYQEASVMEDRIRIGECIHLPLDGLRQFGSDPWALHVPLGKLHSERLVPADAEVRRLVARI
jgi:hypothetical protein